MLVDFNKVSMPGLSAQSPIMQAVVRGRADCNLQRALPKGVGVYGLLMTTQTAKVLVLWSNTHGYPKQC
jgi:hypothetical protein